MSKPNYIEVDGTRYVRENTASKGNRVVIVADRGWIFAGDEVRENGRIVLSNAINVQRWAGVGFDGMLRDPDSDRVTLKHLDTTVDFPESSELFRCPVKEGWGI